MAKGYKVIIKTNYTYNSRNLLTQVTQVEQYTPELVETVTAQYTYDVRGLMTSSNAGGYVTSYTYDSHGNLSSCMYPGETTAETYVYSADGKIRSCTDRNGITKSYYYDALGNLDTTQTGYQLINYRYYKNGLLRSESNVSITTTYTYDSYGRKINDGTASYAYDANSNLVSVTIGSDVTTYSYDRAGRMLSVVNGLSVTNYTYDSRGLRTSTKNYYDGNLITQTDYIYNLAGLATSLINKDGEGNILSSFSYTYQFDGNVSSETDHNGIVTNYTYDLLGRLIAEVNGASSKYYTYDAAGNRTKAIVDGTTQILYAYNDKGQLVSETTTNGETSEVTSYTYDANGNLTAKIEGIKTTNYAYDTFGRMISAGNAVYTYRPNGLRASKTVNSGGTHYFAYINCKMVRDCSDKYLCGLELIKSDTAYYLYNIHGDVIQLVDTDGNRIKTYDYDAYGNEITRDLNDTNPFRYCGEYYDTETGFIYLRARYYDPMVGRFTTVDPAKDGLNWYAYCNDNPIMFSDPSGEFGIITAKLLQWGVGAVVGATFGAVGSIVSQAISGEKINWKDVGIEAASGAISGFVTSTSLGKAGQTIVNGVLGLVTYSAECIANGEKFSIVDAALSTASGAISGLFSGDGVNAEKLFSNSYKTATKQLAKEANRQNRKYAAKKISYIKDGVKSLTKKLIDKVIVSCTKATSVQVASSTIQTPLSGFIGKAKEFVDNKLVGGVTKPFNIYSTS